VLCPCLVFAEGDFFAFLFFFLFFFFVFFCVFLFWCWGLVGVARRFESVASQCRYMFWLVQQEHAVIMAAIVRRHSMPPAIAVVYTPPRCRGNGLCGIRDRLHSLYMPLPKASRMVMASTPTAEPPSQTAAIKIGFKCRLAMPRHSPRIVARGDDVGSQVPCWLPVPGGTCIGKRIADDRGSVGFCPDGIDRQPRLAKAASPD